MRAGNPPTRVYRDRGRGGNRGVFGVATRRPMIRWVDGTTDLHRERARSMYPRGMRSRASTATGDAMAGPSARGSSHGHRFVSGYAAVDMVDGRYGLIDAEGYFSRWRAICGGRTPVQEEYGPSFTGIRRFGAAIRGWSGPSIVGKRAHHTSDYRLLPDRGPPTITSPRGDCRCGAWPPRASHRQAVRCRGSVPLRHLPAQPSQGSISKSADEGWTSLPVPAAIWR